MTTMVDMEVAGRVMTGVGVGKAGHVISGVDEEVSGLHSPALGVRLTRVILCF